MSVAAAAGDFLRGDVSGCGSTVFVVDGCGVAVFANSLRVFPTHRLAEVILRQHVVIEVRRSRLRHRGFGVNFNYASIAPLIAAVTIFTAG
jgi:hypothetical protein